MKPKITLLLLIGLLLPAQFTRGPAQTTPAQPAGTDRCQPTPEDEMGPFYRPGAPLRSMIGSGYLLTGTVKSAATCAAIPSPLLEFWQAGPAGRYSDSDRAAIITDQSGSYRFETNVPPPYVTRPPHIHIRVSARGYQTLVTQHYLQPGATGAVFDLILQPSP